MSHHLRLTSTFTAVFTIVAVSVDFDNPPHIHLRLWNFLSWVVSHITIVQRPGCVGGEKDIVLRIWRNFVFYKILSDSYYYHSYYQ
jgi:hypothetical protein